MAMNQLMLKFTKSHFRCGRRDAHHLPEECVCCPRGPHLPGSRYVQTMPETPVSRWLTLHISFSSGTWKMDNSKVLTEFIL